MAALLIGLGIAVRVLQGNAMDQALNERLFRFWKKEVQSDGINWEPKKIRTYKKEELGTNTPPTKETLQELGMGNSTWVPSGKTPKRKSPPSSAPRRK
ncbi:MAG: hypothetical protein R3C11_11670 [Planctomycetaceae bacterium]